MKFLLRNLEVILLGIVFLYSVAPVYADESDDAICQSYGLPKGTHEYVECMLKIREQNIQQSDADQKRRDAATAQQRELDIEYQKCVDEVRSRIAPTVLNTGEFFAALGRCKQNPYSWHQLPQQTICTPDGYGNVYCQTR